LQDHHLDQVMDQLLAASIDAADIYFQNSRLESWVLEDGIIKEGAYNIEQGVGVRAISGEKTGFAYTDEIELPSLLEAGRTARAIARSGGRGSVRVRGVMPERYYYEPINPLATLTETEKVELLHKLDAEARRQDPRV
ncbi:MAG: metalloprotease TldD, partial [Gammaproteobacteria bacterium]|nr:metalloprotease TldD [Gammaproteobacteria bacterium]